MGNRSTTLHDTTLLTGRPIGFALLTLICRRPTFSSKVDVQLRTLPNSTLGPLVRYRAVAAQVTAPWLRDRSPVLRFVRGRLMAGLPNGAQRAAPNQTACFPTMSASLNRPFGVKRFQTIHHHSVDVARGLVLLFGIGTKALPSWDSRTGWNNLSDGLTVNRTPGPSGMAHWTNSCQTG